MFQLSYSKSHWLFNCLLVFKFHCYLDSIGSFFIKSLRHLNTFSTITWKRLALISKWPINFFWQSIKIKTKDNRFSKSRFLCRMRGRADIKLNQLFIYNDWILKSECEWTTFLRENWYFGFEGSLVLLYVIIISVLDYRIGEIVLGFPISKIPWKVGYFIIRIIKFRCWGI